MAEPVSLFTMGLIRLGERAERNATNAGFSTGGASYSWEKNELSVYAIAFDPNASFRCGSDSECQAQARQALQKLAAAHALRMPDGTWLEFVTSLFTQSGYESKNFYEGKGLDSAVADLAAIVKVNVTLIKNGRIHECQRELKAEQILCGSKPIAGK
jgi:hypothetical protein